MQRGQCDPYNEDQKVKICQNVNASPVDTTTDLALILS